MAAPVFAFLYALAQAGAGHEPPGWYPHQADLGLAHRWRQPVGKAPRLAPRARSRCPARWASRTAWGWGRCAPTSPRTRSTRAGVDAMSEVVERLRIDAKWVLYGHTHRRGPLEGEDEWVTENGATLLNTGSWVHSPSLLRSSSKGSAYWPGTIAMIEATRTPELVHLLDDWTREDLDGMSSPMRQIASIFLIVLGGVALVGGILVRYADQNLLDPETLRRAGRRGARRRGRPGRDRRRDRQRTGEAGRGTRGRDSESREQEHRRDRSGRALSRRAGRRPRSSRTSRRSRRQGRRERQGRERRRPGRGRPSPSDDPKLAKEIRPDLDLPVANTGSTGTLVDVARKSG